MEETTGQSAAAPAEHPPEYEIKVVPLDRRNWEQIISPEETAVCMRVEAEALAATMALIRREAGAAATQLGPGEAELAVSTLAQTLSELLGADIYYRAVGGAEWFCERSPFRFGLAQAQHGPPGAMPS